MSGNILSSNKNLMEFSERRVGLELENPLVDHEGSLIDRETMQRVWEDLARHGWTGEREKTTGDFHAMKKIFDGEEVIASNDGAWSTFELALPPMDSLAEGERLLRMVQRDILPIFQRAGLHYLGIGMNPGKSPMGNAYRTSKPFYQTLESYWHLFNLSFPTSPTSANQTGVSASLREIVPLVNELTKISGLVVALTANSSVSEWQILPWEEFRHPLFAKLFATTDYPDFKKIIHVGHHQPFSSLADYFRYFFETGPRMIVPVFRDGKPIIFSEPCSWLSYLRGGERQGFDLEGRKYRVSPEAQDLNLAMHNQWFFAVAHMVFDTEKISVPDFLSAMDHNELETYLEGKLTNCYVEYRMPAAAPVGEETASAALAVGLVNNVDDLQEFTKTYSWDEWRALVDHAAVAGMNARIGVAGKTLEKDYLRAFVDIARSGLQKRQKGEEDYLDVLYQRIEDGKTPADRVNELLREKKNPKELLYDIEYT